MKKNFRQPWKTHNAAAVTSREISRVQNALLSGTNICIHLEINVQNVPDIR